MKTDPVHYYYKDLETGVEMSFSKTDQWGYAVGFHGIDLEEALNYKGKIPWPELSPDEKAVVDENYENLHKMIREEDDEDEI